MTESPRGHDLRRRNWKLKIRGKNMRHIVKVLRLGIDKNANAQVGKRKKKWDALMSELRTHTCKDKFGALLATFPDVCAFYLQR